jgi:O-antigen ligase
VVLVPVLLAALLVLLAVRETGAPSRWARSVVPKIVTARIQGQREIFHTSTLGWRLRVYECALDLIRERPLAGWGLGGFAPECERRDGITRNHAHNVVLQLASELGLPFTLGAAAWMLWLLICAGRRLATEEASELRMYRLGFFLIVLATFIASQTALALFHDTRLEIVFWTALAGVAAPFGADG